ncbi:MAG TPA: DUF454 domain-containing protein [Actinobacteria bacterium]|nr:DUF454 domain-containing protein [Actinomycetota bacterium]
MAVAEVSPRRLVRVVYLVLGIFFLGLGIVGVVLPLIPTTFPIILAGFFFARSSERFDRWIVNHRLFGPLISDWRAGRGFSVRTKALAITAIALTFTVSIVWVIEHAAIRIGLVLLAVAISTYILWLPTKQVEDV